MDQHRDGLTADHLVGRAAHEQPGQATAAVGLHGDQVRRRTVFENGVGRTFVHLHPGDHHQAVLAQRGGHFLQIALGIIDPLHLDLAGILQHRLGHLGNAIARGRIGQVGEHRLDHPQQREISLHQLAHADGGIEHLLGQRLAVEGHQDVFELGLRLILGRMLRRPDQQHRHRQVADQLVGHATHPEPGQRSPAVRGQHHQVGSLLRHLSADHGLDDTFEDHRGDRHRRSHFFQLGSRLLQVGPGHLALMLQNLPLGGIVDIEGQL